MIDEIESVLSKILSCNNGGISTSTFVTLLKHSKQVIVMDGLMEQRTIEYLRLLRGTTNVNVVFNTYKPREDYTLYIYPYKTISEKYIV